MAETSPAAPGSGWIGSAIVIGLFLLIFVVAPVYNTFFPQSDHSLQLVLTDAKVTDVSETNRHFSYHLDGNEQVEYNFRQFVAADPAARKGYDGDVGWDSSDLSHYLRLGDRLSKAANSPLLTVHRGAVVTHWILYSATPEGKVPPPERPFITHGDSTVIP